VIRYRYGSWKKVDEGRSGTVEKRKSGSGQIINFLFQHKKEKGLVTESKQTGETVSLHKLV